MSWASAVKERPAAKVAPPPKAVAFPTDPVDWDRLVTLDFETYYDIDYTLGKLSTSEYVRDVRFKAQMVGIKIGGRVTRIVPHKRIAAELKKIPWLTHSLLCHNTAFDGFILSHHYGIQPKKLYCSLSMARGLHSNDIGAGLDEVSRFYGGHGKIDGVLEQTKGVLVWPKALFDATAVYCANDTDECLRVFKCMHPKMPRNEMDLIDLTIRMFTAPVLQVDLPRVEIELAREIRERDDLMLSILALTTPDAKLLKGKDKLLEGRERDLLMVRKIVGSNERFADLLRSQGVTPPTKISPAWMKKPGSERDDDDKYAFAFAKDDADFINLPEKVDEWAPELDREKPGDVVQIAVRQALVRALVECRLAVKSTTNITRAERFLTAGAGGMPLPCGYSYYRAHTGRMGGNNKMNMQNLTRGGELRLSILAPKGHQIAVADSGQIEARVSAWLWGQHDLLDAFRASDDGSGRDAYCLFGDAIYGRVITKADKMERFVGKVCVLGLGFKMGAAKLQITLARGALGGPPVFFELARCQGLVNTYRRRNPQIVMGWAVCKRIIEDMAAGRTGSHGPLTWGKETIQLPNGMFLKYPDLRKAMGDKGFEEWSYQSGKVRKKIYDGLLSENLAQSLARIIVCEQMLAISRKHRVVMFTHDEVVTCVRTVQAAKAFDTMIGAMRTAPAWCPDIPLFAEGGFAVNYSK